MENLLRYHIATTEKQLDALRAELNAIEMKIDNLNEFKTKTVVTARYVSFIVSSLSGLITLIVTTLISYFIQKGNHS